MSRLHEASSLCKLATLVCALGLALSLASSAWARPDSAGDAPLPGPGLSYGGIPYGSISGRVAEYFKRRAPSVQHARHLAGFAPAADTSFSIVEQWL